MVSYIYVHINMPISLSLSIYHHLSIYLLSIYPSLYLYHLYKITGNKRVNSIRKHQRRVLHSIKDEAFILCRSHKV